MGNSEGLAAPGTTSFVSVDGLSVDVVGTDDNYGNFLKVEEKVEVFLSNEVLRKFPETFEEDIRNLRCTQK